MCESNNFEMPRARLHSLILLGCYSLDLFLNLKTTTNLRQGHPSMPSLHRTGMPVDMLSCRRTIKRRPTSSITIKKPLRTNGLHGKPVRQICIK